MAIFSKSHRKAQARRLFPDDLRDLRRISGGLERVMASLPKRTDKRHRLCAAYPLFSVAYAAAYVHFASKKFPRFSEKSAN
jgi:hypothetical protein